MTSPYICGLLTIILIKQIFEKNKSSRAASKNRTQFKPEINPASGIEVLACSLDTDLYYVTIMLQLHPALNQ